MAWDMTDYPNSFKNMALLERKEAIKIANALLAEGYPEGRAIPIATSQAERWYQDASETEKQKVAGEPDPTKSDPHQPSPLAAELLTANEKVVRQADGWAVIAAGAKKASRVYPRKEDAIIEARKVAHDKGTKVEIYREDGSLEDTVKPK